MCIRFLVVALSGNINVRACGKPASRPIGWNQDAHTHWWREKICWGEEVWKAFSMSHWKAINQIPHAQESPMRMVWGVWRLKMVANIGWRIRYNGSFWVTIQTWNLSEAGCLARLTLPGKRSPSGTPRRTAQSETWQLHSTTRWWYRCRSHRQPVDDSNICLLTISRPSWVPIFIPLDVPTEHH